MTVTELKKLVAAKINRPLADGAKIVDALVDAISESLSTGDQVTYSGFGTFFIVNYPAKSILDPQGRGHKIIMLPTNVAKFRPSGQLRKKLEKVVQVETVSQSAPVESTSKESAPEPISATEPPEKAGPTLTEDNLNELMPNKAPVVNKTTAASTDLKKVVNIQFRDLDSVKVEKEVLALIPQNIAQRYKLAPIELDAGKLTVAMVDPQNINTIELLKKITQLEIEPVLSTTDEIQAILDQYSVLQDELEDVIEHSDLGISKKELQQAEKEKVEEETDDSPTVRIVYSLLKRAVRERASDVHIEPYENEVFVRYRIDGILQKKVVLPKQIHASIVARLKIMANLKIDEQRLPQDGRFQIKVDQGSVDFRFSTMPCVNGEKIVLRILDKSQGILSLEEIGVEGHGFEILSKNIKKSHGMTLVTGPTGSGKTTTLYAVLGRLMDVGVNIVTLEDPVEYRIQEINQSQINADIGYTFASSLRSVVRQDPDIIMLGEIRDKETAEMAVHAALTGHIVLSTLHTNDASGAIPRLIDMDIEPFLIASSVNTVVGQRLTRKLCPKCKQAKKVSALEIEEIKAEIEKMPKDVKKDVNLKDATFFTPKGCDDCSKNGYKGRIGVFEVLDISENIKDLVIARSTSGKIQEQAIAEGMLTMLQDGILKAMKGVTSLEEVWRVTRE